MLVADIKMPKIDGLELLRQIRADPRLKLIPVGMMTSSKEKFDVEESYSLGANAYVVKPIQLQDFAAAVAMVGRFWGVPNAPPPVSR